MLDDDYYRDPNAVEAAQTIGEDRPDVRRLISRLPAVTTINTERAGDGTLKSATVRCRVPDPDDPSQVDTVTVGYTIDGTDAILDWVTHQYPGEDGQYDVVTTCLAVRIASMALEDACMANAAELFGGALSRGTEALHPGMGDVPDAGGDDA